MGRAPCCDKANVKRGPWSPEEDAKLKAYIEQHGTGGNWITLPQKVGLKRCGKSCRLRWLNYLRPNIKHGEFTEEEDNIICSLYISIGSRWSIIAAQLPGRTDNDIKNYWNTRLKKKLLGKQRKDHRHHKLDMMKENENYFASQDITAYSWPPQPFLFSTLLAPQNDYQQPENSANSHNFQYSTEVSAEFDPSKFNQNLAFMNLLNNNSCNSSSCYYPISNGVITNSFQEYNNYISVGLDHDVLNVSNLQQVDQSVIEMVNSSSTTISTTSPEISTSWEELSPIVYPPSVSNFEIQQEISPYYVFEEPKYLGLLKQ